MPRVRYKMNPANESSLINLKVKGQDGIEVFFIIEKNTQLKEVMDTYCYQQSVDFSTTAFLFDGHRLQANQTPNELQMKNGDEIDVMLH